MSQHRRQRWPVAVVKPRWFRRTERPDSMPRGWEGRGGVRTRSARELISRSCRFRTRRKRHPRWKGWCMIHSPTACKGRRDQTDAGAVFATARGTPPDSGEWGRNRRATCPRRVNRDEPKGLELAQPGGESPKPELLKKDGRMGLFPLRNQGLPDQRTLWRRPFPFGAQHALIPGGPTNRASRRPADVPISAAPREHPRSVESARGRAWLAGVC